VGGSTALDAAFRQHFTFVIIMLLDFFLPVNINLLILLKHAEKIFTHNLSLLSSLCSEKRNKKK